MKINQKYLEIGLIVVIVIIGVCAYNFGYAPYKEKTDALQVEINQLNERRGVLESKIARTDEFNEAIANADSIIDSLLEKYGPGYTMEKAIMMVVDVTDKSGMNVSSMTLSNPTPVFSSADTNENGEPNVVVYGSKLSMAFQTGYTAYKNVVDYINNHPERMTIEDFNLAYNQENGLLSGSMNINLYGVTDENHEYVAPVIEDILIGNGNIFKSIDSTVEDETVEGEETVSE